MRKLIIDGKEYVLRFDMSVMEDIEEEFGSIQNVFGGGADKTPNMRTVLKVIVWMINAGNRRLGRPDKVTIEDFGGISMAALNEMSIATRMAFMDSMKLQADIDVKSHRDGYLDELEKQEKNVTAAES